MWWALELQLLLAVIFIDCVQELNMRCGITHRFLEQQFMVITMLFFCRKKSPYLLLCYQLTLPSLRHLTNTCWLRIFHPKKIVQFHSPKLKLRLLGWSVSKITSQQPHYWSQLHKKCSKTLKKHKHGPEIQIRESNNLSVKEAAPLMM